MLDRTDPDPGPLVKKRAALFFVFFGFSGFLFLCISTR